MDKPRKTETNTKLNKSGGIASPNSPSSKRDDGTKQKGTVIREGQVRTTLRDQTMTIVCNISIPVGLEQYNAKEIEEVVFFPFGKDEDLLQNMNTMFKFDYIAATNDSVNGEWIKHDEPTTYTPDLSKCILNKFSLKSKDTLYPGSLKLVSNKEEFNRIIHLDSDSNITKIACPIFRNHQNQKHTLFEMPEHTMDARRSFMIRFPGLCSGDSNNGLISKSKESNTCTVLQGHPLFEFMKTVTSKQTIKPIVHSEPTEGGLGWSTYKLTEYETIENKAIEYKSSILKMVDLGGVCFKLSRLDNKALSDPTGTVYQANPTQFHQIKNFEIALEFKVRISVTVENEFLHGGIIEKLAKTKRVDMGNGLTLSIHGEIAPSDSNPNE